MAGGISHINKTLLHVPKRAEARQADQLRSTFVDSGVAVSLESVDHQVLYGRRGTGKTHALRYLEAQLLSEGDLAVYIDLRMTGSPGGLFGGQPITSDERAARLLIDLLGAIHTSILDQIIESDELISDTSFVQAVDRLGSSITSIAVTGEVELEESRTDGRTSSSSKSFDLGVSVAPSAGLSAGSESSQVRTGTDRVLRRGREHIALNFSEIARALQDVASQLAAKRIWILIDEWITVPVDLQPLLAEFLVRCVLPLQRFTVKIAAIEQQSVFRELSANGQMIGMELGADISANVDLDYFMVYEQNEDKARDFFRGLFFRHLTSGLDEREQIDGLRTEDDLIRLGFTDRRAFDELVRAAEGVPRDAINIAAKAAMTAGDGRISVPNIRHAARVWYQDDKEGALRQNARALALLNHVVDTVIRKRRTRGFLVNQKSARSELLLSLFDARVLHIARRGYSAQDSPGERYDVYLIDYGAYVDLMQTKSAPKGLLLGEEDGQGDLYLDVPTQDLRAIRRSVLDVDAFELS